PPAAPARRRACRQPIHLAGGPLMRAKAGLATALGLLVALGASAGAPKTEQEKFTGTWLAVSITNDGKEVPAEDVKKVLLIVAGKNYTLVQGKEVIKGTHKLDGSKS